jgi:hypothetical protein
MSVTFHGSFEHITGNLSPFIICALLLESWCNVKQIKKDALWYLLPILGSILYDMGPSLLLNSGIGFSFGLSYVIELMAFSLWTYIITHWDSIVYRRLHAVLVLLAGIPMYSFIGWLLYLVFRRPVLPYDYVIAWNHVLVGVIGLAVMLLYLWVCYKDELKAIFRSCRKSLCSLTDS